MIKDGAWVVKNPAQQDWLIGAYNYEMVRRADRQALSPPYLKADPLFRDLLAPFTTPPKPVLFNHQKTSRRAKYIELPPMAFCVESAKGKILEAIKDCLEQICSEKNIKLRLGPKGKQNRPPAWHWVELLDYKDLLGKRMSEIDRATAAAAREKSLELKLLFKKLLAEETAFDRSDLEPDPDP